MLDQITTGNILFLDIETVPQCADYSQLPPNLATLWEKKAGQLARLEKFADSEGSEPQTLYNRAGIYAEFGKIICISTGILRNGTLWIKSFSGEDETQLLQAFSEFMSRLKEKNVTHLCAHNGKEFDYPYIIRRLLINGLPVPDMLDLAGKKPWEVNHLDTMELWKFGDFKSYTSLELLAAVFGIPTPKDDISGADVGRVYWEENDLPRIVTYCQKDVVTIVNILLRYKGKPFVSDDSIQYVG